MNKNYRGILIREYPIGLWVFAIFWSAVWGLVYLNELKFELLLIGVGVGLFLVVFSSVLIVKIDPRGRTLIIQNTGLIPRPTKELPIREIQAIHLQVFKRRRKPPTYRVAITMENGDEVPLRAYYSGNLRATEKTARKLREALGIEE